MEIQAKKVATIIQDAISKWHENQAKRPHDYIIVNDQIRRIRPLNEHREDIFEVIQDLVDANSEMWHEEDKVRSADDATVLKAIRNINPLNQHRNDLIEEIDEIILESIEGGK